MAWWIISDQTYLNRTTESFNLDTSLAISLEPIKLNFTFRYFRFKTVQPPEHYPQDSRNFYLNKLFLWNSSMAMDFIIDSYGNKHTQFIGK